MKSRLKKNNRRLIKKASLYMLLHSIILNSGDIIEFQVKIISNKPWFQITQESPFNISSYYDGPDFERACDFYVELVLAFKGIKKAEEVTKLIPNFKVKIEKLQAERKSFQYEDMYQLLKKKPLFLGIDDF